MSAARELFRGLIDYAGLFPPAGLSLEGAAQRYREYSLGERHWMLSHFVLPVSRLTELYGHLQPDEVWPCSLISGPLENRGASSYAEVNLDLDIREMVRTLGRIGSRAKIRTGGLDAAAIPSVAKVAAFMRACFEFGVPFKATAGLHHAIRGSYRLTYEPDSASATMHGFVNVFAGAALLYAGLDEDGLTAVLEEESLSEFLLDKAGISWRGRRATTDQIIQARRTLAISFGSCSFEEPVADLEKAGWI